MSISAQQEIQSDELGTTQLTSPVRPVDVLNRMLKDKFNSNFSTTSFSPNRYEYRVVPPSTNGQSYGFNGLGYEFNDGKLVVYSQPRSYDGSSEYLKLWGDAVNSGLPNYLDIPSFARLALLDSIRREFGDTEGQLAERNFLGAALNAKENFQEIGRAFGYNFPNIQPGSELSMGHLGHMRNVQPGSGVFIDGWSTTSVISNESYIGNSDATKQRIPDGAVLELGPDGSVDRINQVDSQWYGANQIYARSRGKDNIAARVQALKYMQNELGLTQGETPFLQASTVDGVTQYNLIGYYTRDMKFVKFSDTEELKNAGRTFNNSNLSKQDALKLQIAVMDSSSVTYDEKSDRRLQMLRDIKVQDYVENVLGKPKGTEVSYKVDSSGNILIDQIVTPELRAQSKSMSAKNYLELAKVDPPIQLSGDVSSVNVGLSDNLKQYLSNETAARAPSATTNSTSDLSGLTTSLQSALSATSYNKLLADIQALVTSALREEQRVSNA